MLPFSHSGSVVLKVITMLVYVLPFQISATDPITIYTILDVK